MLLAQSVKLPEHFRQREDIRAWAVLAANVTIVAASGIVAWNIDAWWAYALAFVLVGARGQSCYILQHEAMHNLLFTEIKLNEQVGSLLSAFLGTQFYLGRKMHWEHHRTVGQANDPNEIYHNVDSRPPGRATFRFFCFHLLGGRLIQPLSSAFNVARTLLIPKGGRTSSVPAQLSISAKQAQTDFLTLLCVQAFMLIAISVVSSPLVYVLLYVLPLSTLTAFFEAIRSFSEHVMPGRAVTEPEKNRRFFMAASRLECFFIAQFDFHYHHVHHMYPNVVTFKTRSLHAWLSQNDPDYQHRFTTRPAMLAPQCATC
jgi:fatty acid desaturase